MFEMFQMSKEFFECFSFCVHWAKMRLSITSTIFAFCDAAFVFFLFCLFCYLNGGYDVSGLVFFRFVEMKR